MNLYPLYNLIRDFEGLRLKPYLCPAGVPTIGYGSTRYSDGTPVKLSDPAISQDVAEEMMRVDAERFAYSVLKVSPVLSLPWHASRLCAIADFAYNLGMTRYKASTLRRRVDEGRWGEAASELSKWVWGGGKKLPGLIKRRTAEAVLLQEGREMA